MTPIVEFAQSLGLVDQAEIFVNEQVGSKASPDKNFVNEQAGSKASPGRDFSTGKQEWPDEC